MADGGRDYGARIMTVPIAPQFRRHIPRWLDNSLNNEDEAVAVAVADTEDVRDEEKESAAGGDAPIANVSSGDFQPGPGVAAEAKKEGEMEFNNGITIATQRTATQLKIVDITKIKEKAEGIDDTDPFATASDSNVVREEPEGNRNGDGGDDDSSDGGTSLGFPEKPDNDGSEDRSMSAADATAAPSETTASSAAGGPEGSPSEGKDDHREGDATLRTSDKGGRSEEVRGGVSSVAQNRHRNFLGLGFGFYASSYSAPPDGCSSVLSDGVSAGGGHGAVELHFGSVLHVCAAGSRKGKLLVSGSWWIVPID